MRHSLLSLTLDLRNLGIKEGDILFVGADLSKTGAVEGKIKEVILQSFLNAVGTEGTIVTNTFTKSFFLRNIDREYVYDKNTPSYTGALAKLFLSHPYCIRSEHPTNSFAAIGKNAELILSDHDKTKSSYFPLQRIMELRGKHMLLGCVDDQNGLASVHLAQENLGLTKRSILSNRMGVLYREGEQINLFRRKDMGGCSRGFFKFYNQFVVNNFLLSGYYGDAYSVLIDAKASYDIVYKTLEKYPRYALCDDPDCFSCRGTWLYNKRDMPSYYFKNFYTLMKKYLSS
jgi:aminoglycoside 3-N-acetyltransferase